MGGGRRAVFVPRDCGKVTTGAGNRAFVIFHKKGVPVLYSFEKYVKLCHELRNKKPTPIAEAAGVQRSLISRWKGGGGITDTSALKLAEYLGVPIEALKEEQKEIKSMPVHYSKMKS